MSKIIGQPGDLASVSSPSTSDVLKGVFKLFSTPGVWRQGAYSATRAGQPTSVYMGECFCLVGGVALALNTHAGDAEDWLDAHRPFEVDGVGVGSGALINWNDDPDRTVAEVMDLVASAIARAEATPASANASQTEEQDQ